MNNTIEVKVKNVYGNTLIYPVCENAKRFALLSGKKTLNQNDLKIIKELGFKIKVSQPEISF